MSEMSLLLDSKMPKLFSRLVPALTNQLRLIRDFDYNLRTNTFLRFLIAGGINTIFGFAIYSASLVAGAPVWLALLIGTVAGTVFNFLTTGGYVFRALSAARFPRFVICYMIVYGVNLGMLELLSSWIGNKTLSQLILLLPVAILSYTLMARFVFPKKERLH